MWHGDRRMFTVSIHIILIFYIIYDEPDFVKGFLPDFDGYS